jgi:hypothetical protein
MNTSFQLIESRLWNLQGGDDWRDMCSTTPADFRGLHFEGPDSCENWVRIPVSFPPAVPASEKMS